MNLRNSCLAIAALLCATTVFAQDDCPYLPAFKTLRQQLDTMSPIDAVAALQKYAGENDNSSACESFEIDRLLGERETKLIKLAIGGKEIPAQVVFRCKRFDSKTAQCQSPMEDGTTQFAAVGITAMPVPMEGLKFQVVSKLPNAKLIGIYRTSMASALDGKPAKHLGNGPAGKWQSTYKTSALMAIYKTAGPWAYRKAVWYFE